MRLKAVHLILHNTMGNINKKVLSPKMVISKRDHSFGNMGVLNC